MTLLDRPALLGFILLAVCALLGLVVLHQLVSVIGGLGAGDAWIDVNAGAAGAVPAVGTIGSWATVLLARRLTHRTERRLMSLSFALVPLIPLLPFAAAPVVHAVMTDRGYERCLVEPGRRFPGSRYQRDMPEACL